MERVGAVVICVMVYGCAVEGLRVSELNTSGRIGALKSAAECEVSDGLKAQGSFIETGVGTEYPLVVEVEADADENIDVAGEGVDRVLEGAVWGVSVVGSPRSFRIVKALSKSAVLWNFSCIRRT